jgi:hypothetical protein
MYRKHWSGAATGFHAGLDDLTYFLGHETIIVARRKGMAIWREKLFVLMAERVVELVVARVPLLPDSPALWAVLDASAFKEYAVLIASRAERLAKTSTK